MDEWTGLLHLTMEDRLGKTVPSHVYFQGALKVMRPIYHDDSGQACYYILNPGGGYLDGDRYYMQIALEPDARLTLTTQSATKVYKTPKHHAYQENEIILKDGSYFEYLPDPLIVYRDGRYKQITKIRMNKKSTLIYSDIITSGWSPDGSQFSYDMIQLATEVYVDDELMVYDHIKLTPNNQQMNALGLMEGFTHIGSMIVVSEQADNEFIEKVYKKLNTNEKEVKIGVSSLPVSGFTLRILAMSSQKIEQVLSECHNYISSEWYQTRPSFLRKY